MMWEKNIGKIRETVRKYPQESYYAVAHAIQPEWIFLKRITWDTGGAFKEVEKISREIILPCLFLRKTKTLSPIVVDLITMMVKKFRPGLLDPVTSAKEKYLGFQQGSAEII